MDYMKQIFEASNMDEYLCARDAYQLSDQEVIEYGLTNALIPGEAIAGMMMKADPSFSQSPAYLIGTLRSLAYKVAMLLPADLKTVSEIPSTQDAAPARLRAMSQLLKNITAAADLATKLNNFEHEGVTLPVYNVTVNPSQPVEAN